MTKEAERDYLRNTGEAWRRHSLGKPFSDGLCANNLAAIGALMRLLPAPPARLVDFGCGGGWTSVFFARYGFEVTGVDIAPDMVAVAEENRALNAPDAMLGFVCGDYENPPQLSAFDCAVFFESLHHADSERDALRAAYNALRPGGVLLTYEPGEGHAAHPGSQAAMRDYGVNERDMPPRLIIATGREIGFAEPTIHPMPVQLYDIFYRTDIGRTGQMLRLLRLVARIVSGRVERVSSIVRMVKPG